MVAGITPPAIASSSESPTQPVTSPPVCPCAMSDISG